MWTDDDLAKLTKLVKKFPGGTPDRWEKIAAILERLPWEVTKMAQKIKNNSYMVIEILSLTFENRFEFSSETLPSRFRRTNVLRV